MASGKLTLTLDPASLAETQRTLSVLSEIEQDAVVKKGLSDAGGVIRRETSKNIRSRVKTHTGNLIKSLSKRSRKIDKQPRVYVGFKRPKGAVSHLLDKGTRERFTKKGYYRGRVRPMRFQTDSVERKGEAALNTLAESIKISVQRITNRRN